jgi:aryl-alcohol dehydrogenase-like predicted oxidoreductase
VELMQLQTPGRHSCTTAVSDGDSSFKPQTATDFKERIPFGKTGLMVNRIGLASGYGVPAAAMEKAYHEYGVNYFYISPLLNIGNMVKAINNLSSSNRDDLLIILARPYFGGFGGRRLENYVEKWLKKLGLERINLIFQDVRKPFKPELMDRVQRLKVAGKIHFAGISSHDRPLFPRITRGEVAAPADFFHVRYNMVHSGAEQDVFPLLPRENRPGIGIYTATCWRKPLKAKNMPPGESPLTAADCYRFVLSNPDVDVCLTAPKTEKQMEENFRALEAGPLDEEEMKRVRHIGKYIYGK